VQLVASCVSAGVGHQNVCDLRDGQQALTFVKMLLMSIPMASTRCALLGGRAGDLDRGVQAPHGPGQIPVTDGSVCSVQGAGRVAADEAFVCFVDG
jgi:hypothetical protein